MTQEFSKTISELPKYDLIHFLSDVFTPQELANAELRFKIAKLMHNEVTQRDIQTKLKCSITTVSKVSRQLKYGFGGFDKALEILKK